jgi:hypothetical protein
VTSLHLDRRTLSCRSRRLEAGEVDSASPLRRGRVQWAGEFGDRDGHTRAGDRRRHRRSSKKRSIRPLRLGRVSWLAPHDAAHGTHGQGTGAAKEYECSALRLSSHVSSCFRFVPLIGGGSDEIRRALMRRLSGGSTGGGQFGETFDNGLNPLITSATMSFNCIESS